MKIEKGVLLKNYTTYRIGGPVDFFVAVNNWDELENTLNWARKHHQKVKFFGGGSNLLFSDEGFRGLAIRILNKGIELIQDRGKTVLVKVSAGVSLAKLVNFSAENSLAGMQWFAGIPGTIGGAIRGNAGAYGKEIGSLVKLVWAVDLTRWDGKNGLFLREVSNRECKFDYRNSLFKQSESLIIWEAVFELSKGEKDKIKKEIDQILKSRSEKHPSLRDFPSAGSVFQNPIVSSKVKSLFEKETNQICRNDRVPAGWLVDYCDLKGKRVGDAMISPKHADFIVNMGNAKAEDVLMLISIIKQKVRNQFNVQLNEEIEIVI